MANTYIYSSNEDVPLGTDIKGWQEHPRCWFDAENSTAAADTARWIEAVRFKTYSHGLRRPGGAYKITELKGEKPPHTPHVLDYLMTYGLSRKDQLRIV